MNNKEYHKQWRKDHPNYHKNYYQKNKEKIKILIEKWREKNPNYVKEHNKKFKINNPNYYKKYYQDNPETIFRSVYNHYKKMSEKFDVTSNEYRFLITSWSKTIRKRDDNKCQICNSNTNLHSHHIFYKSKYPQLSFNINNGVTLCKKCHMELHKLNGK